MELKVSHNGQFLYVFNFSSATRRQISNVNSLLASMAAWSKKYHTDFFERRPGYKIAKQNVSGGSVL